MIKIEAIVEPLRLDSIKVALDGLGIERITISHVFEHCTTGRKTCYRGAEYQIDVQRVKLEMLVSSLQMDEVVDAILQAARIDGPGDDGAILVTELAEAISVRTGQRVRSTIL